MSDLISRSALIAKIENDIKDTENYMVLFSSNRVALSSQLNTLKTYKAIIENQPTAYDMEKVVEDIQKASIIIDMNENHVRCAIDEVLAIEIVKRGGIE